MELIYENLTYKIRGALFEVYKEKGCGFLEDVYQFALGKSSLRSRRLRKSRMNTGQSFKTI